MTRRTGLLAIMAIIGSVLRQDAEAQEAVTGIHAIGSWWRAPTDLRVTLGLKGFKTITVEDGKRTVTITSDEIMDALVGPTP